MHSPPLSPSLLCKEREMINIKCVTPPLKIREGDWGVSSSKYKRMWCYFSVSGFQSNPDLTELLINMIIARRENAILKSCGKINWSTRKPAEIKNSILNQSVPVLLRIRFFGLAPTCIRLAGSSAKWL